MKPVVSNSRIHSRPRFRDCSFSMFSRSTFPNPGSRHSADANAVSIDPSDVAPSISATPARTVPFRLLPTILLTFAFAFPCLFPLASVSARTIQDAAQQDATQSASEPGLPPVSPPVAPGDPTGDLSTGNAASPANDSQQDRPPQDNPPRQSRSREELNNHPDWFYLGTHIRDEIEYVAVHTEPMDTAAEARTAITSTVRNLVRTRVESWTGNHDPHIMENLSLDRDLLMDKLIHRQHKTVMPFHNVYFDEEKDLYVADPEINLFCGYAELKLDPDFKSDVEKRFQNYQTKSRLYTMGAIALAVIGILGITFSYLKMNHLTRGIYSRRLFGGAVVAAIIIILFCISLINHV